MAVAIAGVKVRKLQESLFMTFFKAYIHVQILNDQLSCELKSSSKFATSESLPKMFSIPRTIIYSTKKILPHSPAVYSRDLQQAWQYLHRSSTRSQCLPF